MALTLSEVQTLLGAEVPANRSFTSELNIVRARLLQSVTKRKQISLPVYSDADSNSIVTLPRDAQSILVGAIRSSNTLCSGSPMGVLNDFAPFSQNGSGYGSTGGYNFQLAPGRYAIFQEWTTAVYLRFKFETTEAAGIIHVQGQLAGDDVWSLYSGTWTKGEKLAFSGTAAVTTTKKWDAESLSIVKSSTLGRVTIYAVDDAGTETLVGTGEPSETAIRRKRYKVPRCQDVTPLSSCSTSAGQSYTKAELDALFADSGTITVSANGTTALDYGAFFLRTIKIVASAGSGGYTYNFTLGHSSVKTGAIFTVRLEVAASSNPTLNFYDSTTGGTLLLTVLGDSSNVNYQTLRFEYDGSAFHIFA